MNGTSVTTNPSLSPSRDVTLPQQPRRRRRPALSCNECRRRKVKCDQQVPCTPCSKAKTVVCNYDPDATPKGRLYSTNSLNSTSRILPRHPRNDFTPKVIAPSASRTVFPELTSQGSTVAGSPRQEIPQGQSVQELNERIQQLEKMVTTMVNSEKVQPAPQNSPNVPIDGSILPLKGGTKKACCLTTSHWMSTKKEVSITYLAISSY